MGDPELCARCTFKNDFRGCRSRILHPHRKKERRTAHRSGPFHQDGEISTSTDCHKEERDGADPSLMKAATAKAHAAIVRFRRAVAYAAMRPTREPLNMIAPLPIHHCIARVTAVSALAILGCGPNSNQPAQSTPAAPAAATASTASTASTATNSTPPAAPAEQTTVKIMKEFWPTGKLKFYNEMRKGADGKWDRNGTGRAYYNTGELEREGQYKDGKRIGIWVYFDPEGKETRREDRGTGGAPDAH